MEQVDISQTHWRPLPQCGHYGLLVGIGFVFVEVVTDDLLADLVHELLGRP